MAKNDDCPPHNYQEIRRSSRMIKGKMIHIIILRCSKCGDTTQTVESE